MDWLITYDYPGTTNGRAVGRVYVTGPHFGRGVWSHTYDPDEAATWPTDGAAIAELQKHSWPNAKWVPRNEARDLTPYPNYADDEEFRACPYCWPEVKVDVEVDPEAFEGECPNCKRNVTFDGPEGG